MSEKPETDEYDEDADDTVGEAEDLDLDRVTKDLEIAKRRVQKLGDPAWRRLEQLREEKRTAELTSDFEDYDIGVEDEQDGHARRPKTARRQS